MKEKINRSEKCHRVVFIFPFGGGRGSGDNKVRSESNAATEEKDIELPVLI